MISDLLIMLCIGTLRADISFKKGISYKYGLSTVITNVKISFFIETHWADISFKIGTSYKYGP